MHCEMSSHSILLVPQSWTACKRGTHTGGGGKAAQAAQPLSPQGCPALVSWLPRPLRSIVRSPATPEPPCPSQQAAQQSNLQRSSKQREPPNQPRCKQAPKRLSALAMVRDRLRMVAKQSARSVTEIAPLASSRLNTALRRSRWSYAGIDKACAAPSPQLQDAFVAGALSQQARQTHAE